MLLTLATPPIYTFYDAYLVTRKRKILTGSPFDLWFLWVVSIAGFLLIFSWPVPNVTNKDWILYLKWNAFLLLSVCPQTLVVWKTITKVTLNSCLFSFYEFEFCFDSYKHEGLKPGVFHLYIKGSCFRIRFDFLGKMFLGCYERENNTHLIDPVYENNDIFTKLNIILLRKAT